MLFVKVEGGTYVLRSRTVDMRPCNDHTADALGAIINELRDEAKTIYSVVSDSTNSMPAAGRKAFADELKGCDDEDQFWFPCLTHRIQLAPKWAAKQQWEETSLTVLPTEEQREAEARTSAEQDLEDAKTRAWLRPRRALRALERQEDGAVHGEAQAARLGEQNKIKSASRSRFDYRLAQIRSVVDNAATLRALHRDDPGTWMAALQFSDNEIVDLTVLVDILTPVQDLTK
eukprot:IDg22243t1